MTFSLFETTVTQGKKTHVLYSDGTGHLLQIFPANLRYFPIFVVGGEFKILDTTYWVDAIQILQHFPDKCLESTWEGQIGYSESGWSGYLFHIREKI